MCDCMRHHRPQVHAAFSATSGVLPLPKKEERAGFGRQFVTLLRRAAFDVRRNPMRGKAQIGQAVVFAVIITLIWFQVSNDQNGVQDRSGAMFFFAANGMMQNVMSVLTTFANERAAVLREQENGMFHPQGSQRVPSPPRRSCVRALSSLRVCVLC